MPRWIYSWLLRIALPLAALAFVWRGWRSPAYRGSLRERLAMPVRSRNDRPLWLHAASVGEVRALAVLVRALHAEAIPLLITVGTPTGLARARELFADLRSGARAAVTVQAAPWDLPGAVRRFLRASQPRAGVFIETELWPNLVAGARDAGVPLALVSARLSQRSLRRYLRFAPGMMRATVRAFGNIAAQSAVDRDRFVSLGADPSHVTVGGNLKFDLQLPFGIAADGAHLRARWAQARPVWVAGSTHPEEEVICISAHRALLADARAAGRLLPVLVLAPRRPERFDLVVRQLDATGLNWARISKNADAGADVLLLDVMGELLRWYAAADVAFVGGTVVPLGGHNLLEPAALGKPVLAGPNCFNAPEVAALLQAANALTTIHTAEQLASVLEVMFGDAALAQASGARAAEVVAVNRGAAATALAIIAALST